MKRFLYFILIAAACLSCSKGPAETGFYKAEGGKIMLGGTPQYFIGTNMWYAAKLAVEDPERLDAELDYLNSLGVRNLRVLAVEPEWDAYGILLDKLKERGMCAVLFLNNAWGWSKGYSDYVKEAEGGEVRRGTPEASFVTNERAQALNHEYIKEIVGRFKDHPAIFSWQLCNEPRPFGRNPEVQEAFVKYIHSTAALIKSIDSNHMVSTGSEGLMGCDNDFRLCRSINDCPDIDYMTIHIWPFNWGWAHRDSVKEDVEASIKNIRSYIMQHQRIASGLGKPMVIEEFGYPRDGFEFSKGTPTEGRDKVYDYVFGQVVASAESAGTLAGCNFWAWGGFAEQSEDHVYWKEGDDYCGDPFQEQQGLNSVFTVDESTLAIIRNTTEKLDGMVFADAPVEEGWLFADGAEKSLKVNYSSRNKIRNVSLTLLKDVGLMDEHPDTVAVLTAKPDRKGHAAFDLSAVAPGFYKACVQGAQPFFIGIDPEEIVSPQDKQPDFDEFWDRTLAELATVDPEYTLTLLPENSNELRNVYKVEFKSLGGVPMGGYYCEPVKEGKYPSKIEYMGYGAEPFIFDPSSEPETIQFLVSVRGQGIFLGTTPRNWDQQGIEDKETYYYRGAYADVVRAIDFIASREKCDPDRIYAQGESQGGAFTWIAAALDSRIAAAAPAVPFLGDFPDYAKIVSWPMQEILAAGRAKGMQDDEIYRMLSYFDTKNFTDRIKCPIYMSFGLQDPTCPPHTEFAAFNNVKTEKNYFCVPTCGHSMWREDSWTEERMEWFAGLMGAK